MGALKFVTYKGEKFWLQSSGRYYQSGNKDSEERLVHRRVWVDNKGPIPEGFQVHHRSKDWTDSSIGNLELVVTVTHQSDHMRERMNSDADYRANALAGLALGAAAAAAWHASPEGIEWHRAHGKKSWEGRAPVKAACSVCGNEYETFFPSRSRFCSHACEQKEGFQRNKTASGVCVKCGEVFFFNKYRKQECCSRTCSARLRSERNAEKPATSAGY